LESIRLRERHIREAAAGNLKGRWKSESGEAVLNRCASEQNS
jgi:hypothetical protein